MCQCAHGSCPGYRKSVFYITLHLHYYFTSIYLLLCFAFVSIYFGYSIFFFHFIGLLSIILRKLKKDKSNHWQIAKMKGEMKHRFRAESSNFPSCLRAYLFLRCTFTKSTSISFFIFGYRGGNNHQCHQCHKF